MGRTRDNCAELHSWANRLQVLRFPFAKERIPLDGIYLLFEEGEYAHGTNRIVRVGTHTGVRQLRSRLLQHFLLENKDRSIFRKNIGRCLLHKTNDPYLSEWEQDLTPREMREKHGNARYLGKQRVIEKEITRYMQDNFSFAVIAIEERTERLRLESRIISTLSLCDACGPSPKWLGLHSPKQKIRESGLWLVNELYKKPLLNEDLARLKRFA